jgi:hypothetical protein
LAAALAGYPSHVSQSAGEVHWIYGELEERDADNDQKDERHRKKTEHSNHKFLE